MGSIFLPAALGHFIKFKLIVIMKMLQYSHRTTEPYCVCVPCFMTNDPPTPIPTVGGFRPPD